MMCEIIFKDCTHRRLNVFIHTVLSKKSGNQTPKKKNAIQKH